MVSLVFYERKGKVYKILPDKQRRNEEIVLSEGKRVKLYYAKRTGVVVLITFGNFYDIRDFFLIKFFVIFVIL